MVDFIYYIIGGYYILAGILGIGMYLIWITLRFKVKIYDLNYLYGNVAGRIISIIIGVMIILFRLLTKNLF